MGDLISRSEVIDTILTENQRCITSTGHEMSISMICDFILNQPTAYDVDAVVAELEKDTTCRFRLDGYIPKSKAIDIVRNAGKDGAE